MSVSPALFLYLLKNRQNCFMILKIVFAETVVIDRMIPYKTEDGAMRFRHELKYLVTDADLAMLKSRLMGVMVSDPHAGDTGCYRIRSLYFDDIYNSAYLENENGTGRREKFRIRIYNGSMDRISLERKSKVYDKIRKVACIISRDEYEVLTDPMADKTIKDEYPELMKLVLSKYHSERLSPKVIVEYERRPYVYRAGNVRVTFDMNVTSSNDLKSFSQPRIFGRPVMPVGAQLLEVKYDEFLPDHIYRSIAAPGLALTTYSKYYLCRKYTDR